MKVKRVCRYCSKPAEIIREFEGESLCLMHFRQRVFREVNNVVKKISKLQAKLKKIRVVDTNDERSKLIIDKLRQATTLSIDTHSYKPICGDPNLEVNYLKSLSKWLIEELGETAVIIPLTAEELAHNILILTIYSEYQYAKNFMNPLVFRPYSTFFTHELSRIIKLTNTLDSHCPTAKLVVDMATKRQSNIFSILSFIQRL